MLLYETLSQPLIFLIMIGIGFGCGFLADVRNLVFFLCNKNKIVAFILDIITGLICGIFFLLSVLSLNFGELRFYLILGFFIGFLIQRFFVSSLIAKFSKIWYNNFKEFIKRLYGKPKKKKENINS